MSTSEDQASPRSGRQDTMATLSSTTTNLGQSVYGGPDPDLRTSVLDSKGLSRILIDAVRYNELLAEDESSDDENPRKDVDGASVRRLAGLDTGSFSVEDLAATERYAQIAALEKEEPESYGETTDEPEEMSVQDLKETLPVPSEKPARYQSVSQLSPPEIIGILVNEFGPLTDPEKVDDREELLVELDGAYFQEIAILGMLHLTTHRVTFHASLLSTRPDLMPEKQIIKTGPLTLHRKGLRRKMRVWAELSHDMITIFPSSKPEDRLRPIKSVLLANVEQILPEDKSHPQTLKIVGDFPQDDMISYVEIDTEESAREWRKEIQGALFLYHHGRATYLSRPVDDDRNGVHISVPLSRISTFKINRATVMKNSSLISLDLAGKFKTSLPDDDKDSASDSDLSSDPTRVSDEDGLTSGQTLIFNVHDNPHDPGNPFETFGELVEKAKRRDSEARGRVEAEVVVDFGQLSFVGRRRSSRKPEDDKEDAIRRALSLGEEGELWYCVARISRKFSASTGFFVISAHYIAFWTKTFRQTDSKYRFAINKVVGAKPRGRVCPNSWGMVLELREHSSLMFDFASLEERDDVVRRVAHAVHVFSLRHTSSANSSNSNSGTLVDSASESSRPSFGPFMQSPVSTPTVASTPNSPRSASHGAASNILAPISHTIERASTRIVPKELFPFLPKVLNLPPGMVPRQEPKHFVCLTIGSRGDVQPYIAIALELKRMGNTVTIVTHQEYKEWVEGWGIQHRTAGGDPGALMKLSVEHKMFSPQFFKESLGNFRKWLDDLLVDSWEQCKDADVLLESPSAMAGVHIAEALNIPYFRTFTMPWSKTTAFPQPFLSPPVDLPAFNASSYVLFDNVFWTATSGQINRWRKNTLKIGKTDMDHLAQSKIPFIYNFSPSVVPRPMDWGDTITISGYWFLDNPDLGWTPPTSLLEWIAKARADGKAIVYIGFGSITVPNPTAMTRSIIKAVLKSDVRAIISKGWSARMSKSDEPEIEIPPECYPIDKVPHDWLFPQIDAALHHGGAGTTGASLRAGIPTLIKPWFGDQFFWASRVQKIGAGLRVSSLSSHDLASALSKATTDRIMKERAAAVGYDIRQENGVQCAVRAIYTYLARAARRTETTDSSLREMCSSKPRNEPTSST